MADVLKKNEMGIAWDETEKGRFREDYFPPLKILMIAHTPWADRTLPIPPGIRNKVIQLVREKVASGLYEPSNSSYRSQWFVVAKSDGGLCIVHNLKKLNAITVCDSGQPPIIHLFIEQCGRRGIYSGIDVIAGFDHGTLHEDSQDPTTFDTPIGTFRLARIPQGWTGSVPVFHGHVAFLLQDETEVSPNFIDDLPVLGPKTRYEKQGGDYEVLVENSGIHRFVWEHALDLNRILHRLKHAGVTVSAKKLKVAVPELKIVGTVCTYEGRLPDNSKVVKIQSWPACESITEVRGFLGMAGVLHVWIKDFARITRPLVNLTKKDVTFIWLPEHQQAMANIKDAVSKCEALVTIDYLSLLPVIMAVDSSYIACGIILSQDNKDGRRCQVHAAGLHSAVRDSEDLLLTLIVLSRYTYPFILVPSYCLLFYPAGTTHIAP
ncbi:DNA RNA polymerase [Lentinula edodes]|uniref:DNA RNA polymerase n=1 Tax=Lentinula edodes TaxID=5353 RepID=A0A1Q3EER5_LENED|nr:DNA RNA polymerase [Lentinula edodes]